MSKFIKKHIAFVDILQETPLAFLFNLGYSSVWLPKSKITVFYSKKLVFVPVWLCLKLKLK